MLLIFYEQISKSVKNEPIILFKCDVDELLNYFCTRETKLIKKIFKRKKRIFKVYKYIFFHIPVNKIGRIMEENVFGKEFSLNIDII